MPVLIPTPVLKLYRTQGQYVASLTVTTEAGAVETITTSSPRPHPDGARRSLKAAVEKRLKQANELSRAVQVALRDLPGLDAEVIELLPQAT